MLAKQAIEQLLGNQPLTPKKEMGTYFAPSNIALVKYWGKRDEDLPCQ